jgi:hypothetical protein
MPLAARADRAHGGPPLGSSMEPVSSTRELAGKAT